MEYDKDSMGFEVTDTRVVYVAEADVDFDFMGFDDEEQNARYKEYTPYIVCWIRREITNKFFKVIGGPDLFQGQSFEDKVIDSLTGVLCDLDLGSIDTLTDPVTGEDVNVYDFDYSKLPKVLTANWGNQR